MDIFAARLRRQLPRCKRGWTGAGASEARFGPRLLERLLELFGLDVGVERDRRIDADRLREIGHAFVAVDLAANLHHTQIAAELRPKLRGALVDAAEGDRPIQTLLGLRKFARGQVIFFDGLFLERTRLLLDPGISPRRAPEQPAARSDRAADRRQTFARTALGPTTNMRAKTTFYAAPLFTPGFSKDSQARNTPTTTPRSMVGRKSTARTRMGAISLLAG